MTEPDYKLIQAKKFRRTSAETQKLNTYKKFFWVASLSSLFLFSSVVFLFNSRAVTFAVLPIDSRLEIVGSFVYPKFGSTYLLLKGEYKALVSKSGYEDLTYEFEVSKSNPQKHQLQMKKLPGILNLIVSDGKNLIQDAEIYIQDELKGYSSDRIDSVAAGLQKLEIKHPLFTDFSETIEVLGKGMEQEIEVILQPEWALIAVETNPPKAELFLGDESLGKTPTTVKLGPGKTQLLVSLSGFTSKTIDLEVIANQKMVLDPIKLEPNKGILSLKTNPPDANINVNDAFIGQTPKRLELSPDKYRISFMKTGYETKEVTVIVSSDQTESLLVNLAPLYGKIRLSGLKEGAKLFLDGKIYEGTPGILTLLARPYDLQITQPGFLPFETTVLPNPLATQEILVSMQTLEEAEKSKFPPEIFTSINHKLVLVNTGKFKMGADRRQPGRRANEIEKKIEIKRYFYLSSKEITNKEYLLFDPSHNSGSFGRAYLNDPQTPVVNISWEKAILFCNWLSARDEIPKAYFKKDGKWELSATASAGYRLPTEAEWAWAIRNSEPKEQVFPWGDSMPPPKNYGNFADVSAKNMYENIIFDYQDTFRGPAPPGSFASNKLNIYDLAGNVSEWVHDIYSTSSAQSVLIDPIGPMTGKYRVIRGSNYSDGSYSALRLTRRNYGLDARPDTGFRIARFAE